MFVLRFSKRDRYARALRYLWGCPDRYQVFAYGKDYGAENKDRAAGCGWFIHYLKIPT